MFVCNTATMWRSLSRRLSSRLHALAAKARPTQKHYQGNSSTDCLPDPTGAQSEIDWVNRQPRERARHGDNSRLKKARTTHKYRARRHCDAIMGGRVSMANAALYVYCPRGYQIRRPFSWADDAVRGPLYSTDTLTMPASQNAKNVPNNDVSLEIPIRPISQPILPSRWLERDSHVSTSRCSKTHFKVARQYHTPLARTVLAPHTIDFLL